MMLKRISASRATSEGVQDFCLACRAVELHASADFQHNTTPVSMHTGLVGVLWRLTVTLRSANVARYLGVHRATESDI